MSCREDIRDRREMHLPENYIESRFRELNLNSEKQEFSFLQSVKRGQLNRLEIDGKVRFSGSVYTICLFKDTLVRCSVGFCRIWNCRKNRYL